MPTTPSRRAAIATALLVLSAPTLAHARPQGSIRTAHPWIRPTPPDAPTAAGYLSITNTGRTPDRLLGGTSPRAKALELHSMSMAGGVMRMRPLAGGLDLPPGRTVVLAPGGLHLMLVGPKGAMKVGERVATTLRFEKAGSVPVTFQVEQPTGDVTGMR